MQSSIPDSLHENQHLTCQNDPWGYMYSFRRPWRASLRYRSLIAEVCLSLFFLPLHQLPSLGACPKPFTIEGPLVQQAALLSGMRYHCLSPDTFFFSVSLAFRKCAHSCLASLCHSSTATANLLHQPSRVGCSASTLIHLFYTSRLEAGSSFHAHINLQTPNILSSLGCGATYYFSVLNFRFKVPSDIP